MLIQPFAAGPQKEKKRLAKNTACSGVNPEARRTSIIPHYFVTLQAFQSALRRIASCGNVFRAALPCTLGPVILNISIIQRTWPILQVDGNGRSETCLLPRESLLGHL